MGEQLGRLLSSGVGADLTFEVGGETFAAHRYILAVRSPVLLEEIISDCLTKRTEAARCGIQISGVEARVFKALLQYIYTDSLPEIDEGETTDMARHSMAVANRYDLDRLKLICEYTCKRRGCGQPVPRPQAPLPRTRACTAARFPPCYAGLRRPRQPTVTSA
jgi:speckle-type POZ protein